MPDQIPVVDGILYHANVSRDGEKLWLIHVFEIDKYTQAHVGVDGEVEHMARDLIATWLNVGIENVDVVVEYT